jgi:HK97 family phage prohead protease
MGNGKKSQGAEPVNARQMRGNLECVAQRANKQYPIDEENHRMWFRASTEGLKPDGINILASAWKKDIKAWLKKNPAFLPMHNYWTWSIGHGVDAVVDDMGLLLNMEFAVGRNPEATMAWSLYRAGDMNAVSVGWETAESHEEEIDKDDDRKRRVLIVTRARLLELSAVPVPMDEDALAVRMRQFVESGEASLVGAARKIAELYPPDAEMAGEGEEPEAETEIAEHTEGEGSLDLAAVMEELKNLRTMVGAVLIRQNVEPPIKITLTNVNEEPAYLQDMRRTAKAVTLTGREVMEQLTRHGSDAEAERRS